MKKWQRNTWTSMWCTLHLLVALVVLGPQKAVSLLPYSGQPSSENLFARLQVSEACPWKRSSRKR